MKKSLFWTMVILNRLFLWTDRFSVVWTFTTFVKALQEITFVTVLSLFKSWKTICVINMTSWNWCNFIKNISTPNVSLLDIIKSFVPKWCKLVNYTWISHFIVRPPVSCKIEFGVLWRCISSKTCPVNNKRHISAPFSKQTKWFEMCLWKSSWFG